MDDFDTIPVRLPSGRKAVVLLPTVFTAQDAAHLTKFLALYTEESISADFPEAIKDDTTKPCKNEMIRCDVQAIPKSCPRCGLATLCPRDGSEVGAPKEKEQ